MGLTELKDILVKHEITLEDVRGVVAIDAFNALYQFLSIIRQKDGTPLMDSQGRVSSHLSGLFYRTCGMLEKGVLPVYVFDGKPSDLKKKTIAERVERKREAEELLKQAREEGREADAAMLAQRTSRLTKDMATEAKQLLALMGLPVVLAPSEGEAECAVLCEKGLVKAACSQDFDSLLFGTPRLVRNLAIAGRRKLPRREIYVDVVPEEFFLKENLDALGLTRQKLVWIALLCGTDFNQGVKGIGPKKGLKLVKEHSSFREVLQAAKSEMDFEEVEQLFLHPPQSPTVASDLAFREPDKKGIEEFMLARDFSKERIQNALGRAFKEPLTSQQEGLGKWF